MNNRLKIIVLLLLCMVLKIDNTYSYFYTTDEIENTLITNKYNIKLNAGIGRYNDSDITYKDNRIILPEPYKEGYTFKGYINNNSDLFDIVVNDTNQINNQELTAMWDRNEYNVNYYLDGKLLFQRKVKYDDIVENIDIQSLLTKYQKFNGWNNYYEKMPPNDINLTANVTSNHCKLTSGHGPSGNAISLMKIFKEMGYNASIKEVDNNEYLAETDYSLTLKEFEDVKSYLEENTNYTSYFPYPYLYWLGLDCDNGYSINLVRNVGDLHFR